MDEPIKLTLSRRYYQLIEESVPEAPDALIKYTKECADATGITVGSFNCDNGTPVPGQIKDAEGKCLAPNVLNSRCDPGSKFQVLQTTRDAVAVAHCRKDIRPQYKQTLGKSDYNDIAVIVTNKTNGATCFFQALGYDNDHGIPGDVKSPAETDNPYPWESPRETAKIGCTGCHDTGAFIRSPYLAQLKEGPHVLPSWTDGYGNNNRKLPPRYVGEAFKNMQSWYVDAPNPECVEGQVCTPCNSCHLLAVNNFGGSFAGTAVDLAIRATDKSQESKVEHSVDSPIWMRPGQVTFQEHAAAAAQSFQKCALDFIDAGMKSLRDDCEVKEFGGPYVPPAPSPNTAD